MKLTYSTMIGDVFEKYIFEGSTGEVLAAWSALFDFEDPDESESCSLTGRSCSTCKYRAEQAHDSCQNCGLHYANYKPAAATCSTCKHRDSLAGAAPCRNCYNKVSHPFWEPQPPK